MEKGCRSSCARRHSEPAVHPALDRAEKGFQIVPEAGAGGIAEQLGAFVDLLAPAYRLP
jgi:hypothetical protein